MIFKYTSDGIFKGGGIFKYPFLCWCSRLSYVVGASSQEDVCKRYKVVKNVLGLDEKNLAPFVMKVMEGFIHILLNNGKPSL